MPHLLQYVSNENYYGRIKVGGKTIREGLATTLVHRQAAVDRSPEEKARRTPLGEFAQILCGRGVPEKVWK